MANKYRLTKQECRAAIDKAARLLLDYCRQNNLHFLVTGVSGGLDSAVTIGICARAREMGKSENWLLIPVGLIMPCESKPEAEELAMKVINRFDVDFLKYDLSLIYQVMSEQMLKPLNIEAYTLLSKYGFYLPPEKDRKISQGNIKARLRMIMSYHVAKMLGGMVLSNDNLSEFWMAFWTINGDVGDLGMIQHIMKGLELFDIARELEVPEEILAAKPDDGLGIAGGDADQLGAEYPVIDTIMTNLIQQGFDPNGSKNQLNSLPKVPGIAPALVALIATRCINGSFKRRGTITFSRKDLGLPPISDIVL